LAGEILREKREELGLSIAEIADFLKIGEDYLAAIEADDFEKLPVPVYTMGYIRCYASRLGIDPEPVIEYYTKRLSRPQSATIIPIAFSRKKRPPWGYALILLAAGIILLLVFSQWHGQPDNSGSIPSSVLLPASTPAPGAVQEQEPKAKTQVERTAPAEKDSRKSAEPQTKMHSLAVTARAVTWVLIKFPAERKTEEIMFQPGMKKSWEFPGDVVLKIGNAGGVKVLFDGRDMGPLGNPGEVKILSLPQKNLQPGDSSPEN